MPANRSIRSIALAIAASFAAPLGAQQGRVVTPADYDHAKEFLAPALNGMVVGGTANATWAPDGRFWYRNTSFAGNEIVVIDPAAKTRKRCDANVSPCEGITIPAGGGGRGGRGGGGGRAGGGGRGAAATAARASRSRFRRMENAGRSCATGTSGCTMWRVAPSAS
jgi:hypothetical protein